MRTFVFASRNTKEILRDMITLFFGLGFPLVLMVLLSAINASIPQEAAEATKLFQIQNLAPGISVFGLSFISLFSAQLISKDRTTSFVLRLFTQLISKFIFIYCFIMLNKGYRCCIYRKFFTDIRDKIFIYFFIAYGDVFRR